MRISMVQQYGIPCGTYSKNEEPGSSKAGVWTTWKMNELILPSKKTSVTMPGCQKQFVKWMWRLKALFRHAPCTKTVEWTVFLKWKLYEGHRDRAVDIHLSELLLKQLFWITTDRSKLFATMLELDVLPPLTFKLAGHISRGCFVRNPL